MKEQKISKETARRAKEKGFDWKTKWFYHPQYGLYKNSRSNYNGGRWDAKYYSAPTQSLLQKWLRDKHNILIYVYPYKHHAADVNDKFVWKWCIYPKPRTAKEYDSYESVLESALKSALKRIESKQIEMNDISK